jgi:triphosphoribosyl-dephospho-CoA synthase
MKRHEAEVYVGRCATLAALLEVSAYPKPGNVHRTRDFPKTRYEHFLAGSVALNEATRKLAAQGFEASGGSIGWDEIGVGQLALEAVSDSLGWQGGGNVNLGVVLLFAPIAAAAGATLQESPEVEALVLRESLRSVINNTTPNDAVNVYEAIRVSMAPGVLGEAEELDVLDDSTSDRIRDEGLDLQDVFSRCSERDSICSEWTSDFRITFETGYPYLKRALEDYGDVNSASVDTFLLILSGNPDSLIRRKSGHDRALEVSDRARLILDEGGSRTSSGARMLGELDAELQDAGGALNPGTTADLTAASTFLALLEGWRP